MKPGNIEPQLGNDPTTKLGPGAPGVASKNRRNCAGIRSSCSSLDPNVTAASLRTATRSSHGYPDARIRHTDAAGSVCAPAWRGPIRASLIDAVEGRERTPPASPADPLTPHATIPA